jgi:very-short-patch-repair endonuclease
LIIELDGSQHMEQVAYDAARTEYMEGQGYRVIRSWNDDVLLRVEDVLHAIVAALGAG